MANTTMLIQYPSTEPDHMFYFLWVLLIFYGFYIQVWSTTAGAYMTAKGYNNRCLLAWLANCLALVIKKELPANRYVGAWIQSVGKPRPTHDMLEPTAVCMWLTGIKQDFGEILLYTVGNLSELHVVIDMYFHDVGVYTPAALRDALNRFHLKMESSGRYLWLSCRNIEGKKYLKCAIASYHDHSYSDLAAIANTVL